MKQPIYVVRKDRVLFWINHLMFIIPPFRMCYGTLTSKEELLMAVKGLKCDEYDRIHMSRLAQCIQSFYTCKMIAGANSTLMHLWRVIKNEREII